MSDISFLHHSEKCIQCHTCETACKSRRGSEHGVKLRRVYNVWHGGYPDISSSTVSVACLHCTEPACVKTCSAGAIRKRAEDGIVLVDHALCTGCRECGTVCPVGAPQFGGDGIMQKCDLCISDTLSGSSAPICVLVCPTQALELAQMSAEEKSEQ